MTNNKIIGRYLSVKFSVLSFFLIILVIIRHSYNINAQEFVVQNGFSSIFQDFIINFISRIPSSLFFLISGFLFFLNYNSNKIFFTKLMSRIKSVFLPYIIWSLWGLLFLYILQMVPDVQGFFSKGLIRTYQIDKIISTVVINPIPYQLWFLRDLFIFCCLAPVLFILLKHLRIFLVILLGIIWVLGFEFVIFYSRSLLFFMVGGLLSKNSEFLEKKQKLYLTYIFVFIWISLSTFLTLKGYNQLYSTPSYFYNLLNDLVIVSGILAIWGMYDNLLYNRDLTKSKYYYIVGYTFFLYVYHEPVLTIFRKGLLYFTGKEQVASFFVFIIAPSITILLGIILGRMLDRLTPGLYQIITGRRKKRNHYPEIS